jgi:hypothetical protein
VGLVIVVVAAVCLHLALVHLGLVSVVAGPSFLLVWGVLVSGFRQEEA